MNNKLMKKTDSTEETSLVVKGQRGRSKSRRLKRIQRFLTVLLAIFIRNHDTSRKIIWNIRRCWRKKAIKILMGLIPVESRTSRSLWCFDSSMRKEKNTQIIDYLTWGTHATCAQKKIGSVHISLSMEAVLMSIYCVQDSWYWQHPYEDVWWTSSNPHERASRFRSKKESSLVKSFGSSKVQVLRCRWRY